MDVEARPPPTSTPPASRRGNAPPRASSAAAQATYEAAGKGNHPIVCVNFAQAIGYCKAQNKRLASDEEEWEWAAQRRPRRHTSIPGATRSRTARRAGRASLRSRAPARSAPAPPATRRRGIHDLAGNVFEWTTSRNDKAGPLRIGRGGSWRDSSPEGLKASRPGPGFLENYRCGFLGIRCVVEPAAPR